MFLVPAEASGVDVGRHIGTVDRSMLGGHCEMTFTDVLVPDSDLWARSTSAWTSERLPSYDRLGSMYVDAEGHELTHCSFHLALANFKIAAIDHSRRSGAGGGSGFDTAGAAVPRYLELARDALS